MYLDLFWRFQRLRSAGSDALPLAQDTTAGTTGTDGITGRQGEESLETEKLGEISVDISTMFHLYPLVMTYKKLLNMAIEIVSLFSNEKW